MTSWRASLTFDAPLQRLLSQSVPFFADLDRIFPQLGSEDLLYHQYGQKCHDVHVVEQPLKSPATPLSCYPESLVNLFAVSPLKNHIAGLIRLQLYPEVFRFGQLLQALQKLLVLLCQFHALSP